MHIDDLQNPQHLPEDATPEQLLVEATIEATVEVTVESPSWEGSAPDVLPSVEALSNALDIPNQDDIARDLGLAPEGEPEEEPQEAFVFRDLDSQQLQASIEALLFMQHKPISVSRLRELIHPEIEEETYRTAISNLMASYFDDQKGIELVEIGGSYQLRTKQDYRDVIRRLYQITPMKLTNAMLEVLAISAYNQPITKDGIERVRGVDSSHLIRVLLDKKMLRIVGKSDEVGRPMLYATTKEFLETFGLRDLSALPSLREIEDMIPQNEVGAEISEEEVLSREMAGIVTESKPLEFNDLEVEDLEAHETQEPNLPSQTHSHRSAKSDLSPETGSEAGGDLLFPEETARNLPLGPEGHA